MNLRFTPQATQVLSEIANYIRTENPPAAERVGAAILESLQACALVGPWSNCRPGGRA